MTNQTKVTIDEEVLSDGSKVYNVRLWDNYGEVEIPAIDLKAAEVIFYSILENSCIRGV